MKCRVLAVVVAVSALAASDADAQDERVRWSGNFQPVQIRSPSVAMRIQSRIYGTAELQTSERDPARARARLRFNVQTGGSSFTVQWGVVPGRCGSGALPVLPVENFPIMEVGSNGRAQLDEDIPFELPTSGEYHVNVYLGGTQLDNVITCANLRKAG